MAVKTVEIGGVETFVVVQDGAVEVAADEYVTHPYFKTADTAVELYHDASFKIVNGSEVHTFDTGIASISGNEHKVSKLPSYDDYDYAFQFDTFTIVTEVATPNDDEVTVDVDGTKVRVVAEDGSYSAEIVEKDFVSYVEEIVSPYEYVVEANKAPFKHDAVIVAGASHGSMRVDHWIDEFVNDGGITVKYIAPILKEDIARGGGIFYNEWVGRAMICVDDVRGE